MTPGKYSFFFYILTFLSISSLAKASVVDHWHWRNPNPFANSLRSISYGNGKFVAVGDGGVIHTSPDGATWDGGQRPVSSTLHKVIFANGNYVAVGDNGTIVISPDGNSWTNEVSGTTNSLYSVTYGNGHYVACGQAGCLVVSPNGSTWTVSAVGTADLKWITAGNGVFVLPTPNQQTSVQVSTDAVSWTTESLNSVVHERSHALLQAAFGNGVFVAAVEGELQNSLHNYDPAAFFYYSNDGTNWTQGVLGGAAEGEFQFLDYANGAFHDFGANGSTEFVESTPDGSSLSFSLLPSITSDITSLTYGNGKYVATGTGGEIWLSTDSVDTTNWVLAVSGFRNSFYQITYGPNGYVALADSQPVLRSADGINFAPVPSSPVGMTGIAFDGTNYVGLAGTQIFTSSNSVDWAARNSNVAPPKSLFEVCRGANGWVAVGSSGTIISSGNALAWTLRTSGTANHLFGVAYGNGTYVAVGNSGTVMTSPDGTTWTAQFADTLAGLTRVRFLNGLFVATGGNGVLLSSPDGVNWLVVNSGTTTTFSDVAYGAGMYLAGGSGVFFSSIDGTNWVDITTKVPVSVTLNRVAFLNGSFWLCGANGTLVQSDSIDGMPQLAGSSRNNGFQINVLMNTPQIYRIQARSDLSSTNLWQDLVSLTNASSWIDTNATSMPARLYRVISP
jgi:hypothetical protein